MTWMSRRSGWRGSTLRHSAAATSKARVGFRQGVQRALRLGVVVAPWLLALVILSGCASTKVTSQQPYTGAALPRPDRIIVHDFGATPGEVPGDSALAAEAAGSTPQTAEEVEAGRKLGAEVTRQLTLDLQNMGLPAVQAVGQAPPRPDDIVVKGNFYGIDEGSRGKRVLLGFGSGAAELRTAVEAYQMTPDGLRRLAGGTTDAGTGKTPGMVAPLAVFAATANPIGLIVVGASKIYGERSGNSTIEGDAKRTADEVAARFKVAAQKQGWI
jgi:Domain of unknown function (DUF4410)